MFLLPTKKNENKQRKFIATAIILYSMINKNIKNVATLYLALIRYFSDTKTLVYSLNLNGISLAIFVSLKDYMKIATIFVARQQ